MPANLEDSVVATRSVKDQFSFQSQRKTRSKRFKLLYNCTYLHASKIMLKILQARFQQYMNHEFQMFKLDFEKAEEPEIVFPTSVGSSIKQESSRKTSTCSLLTMPKLLTVWITANYRKF